jgi:hypothetical protein
VRTAVDWRGRARRHLRIDERGVDIGQCTTTTTHQSVLFVGASGRQLYSSTALDSARQHLQVDAHRHEPSVTRSPVGFLGRRCTGRRHHSGSPASSRTNGTVRRPTNRFECSAIVDTHNTTVDRSGVVSRHTRCRVSSFRDEWTAPCRPQPTDQRQVRPLQQPQTNLDNERHQSLTTSTKARLDARVEATAEVTGGCEPHVDPLSMSSSRSTTTTTAAG